MNRMISQYWGELSLDLKIHQRITARKLPHVPGKYGNLPTGPTVATLTAVFWSKSL